MSENNTRDNQDDLDVHSSVPESSQYIQESTMIASSIFEMNNEALPSSEDSSSRSPEFTPSASSSLSGDKKSGFDIKKNAPFLAVGVIGVVIAATVGIKMMGAQSAGPVASPKYTAVAAPEPVAYQAPVAMATPAVVAPVVSNESLKAAENRIETNSTDIAALDIRVAKLEANGVSQTPSTITTAASSVPRKLTAAQRAAAAAKKAERAQKLIEKKAALEAKRRADAAEQARITQAASLYKVHAVKDNLVWLTALGHGTKTFAIGDVVPGVGAVTSISESNRNATVGGRVIR